MELLVTEFLSDPRTYALAVACFGWWSERERTKELHAQLSITSMKLADALIAIKQAGEQ